MPRNAVTNRLVQRNYEAALSGGVCRTTAVGLDINTSGASAAFWYYPLAADGNVAVSFENSANSAVFRLNIETTTRKLFTWTVSGGVGRAHKPSYTISLNAWHYIVFTYADAGGGDRRSTIYVDGVSIGTETSAGLADTSSRFSCSAVATSRYISDVRVFNSEISADDVSNLYYNNRNPSAPTINWLLTDGAGSSATDSSGNGWTGTISSVAWTGNTPMKARKLINGNMVKNGNFDYAPPFTAATTTSSRYIDGSSGGSATNDLFGWFLTIGSGFTGSAQFDTSVKRSGAASLKLVSTVGNGASTVGLAASQTAASGPTVAQQNQYLFRISPNTDYVLTAYIKTDSIVTNDGNGARIRAVQYGGVTTSNTGTSEGNNVTGTNDWTVSTVRFTSGSSSRFIQVIPVIYGDTTGTAWFDDISLTPVYPEGRVPANGNLVKNFLLDTVPTFTAATTSAGVWITGVSGGSSTNSTYKFSNAQAAVVASASAEFDTTDGPPIGGYCLKLSALDATGAITCGQVLNAATPAATDPGLYPVLPSTSYTFRGWIRTNNVATNGAFFDLREFNASRTTVTTTSSTKYSGTNGWTEVTVSFTTNASTRFVAILFRNNVAGNVSWAKFGGLYLAKAEVAPSAAAAATGTITVTDYQYLAGNPATATLTVTDWTAMAAGILDLGSGMLALVEGSDFTAETSNEQTAINLAAALDAAIEEPSTTVDGASVTISIPGSMNGTTLNWTVAGGLSPASTTFSGGIDSTRLNYGSAFNPFESGGLLDPGTSNNECAANIAAVINATPDVSASSVGNVVTITYDATGTAGNSWAMSQQAANGGTISNGLSFSGATLSGGSAGAVGVYPGRVAIT